jgi:hypothetical protein
MSEEAIINWIKAGEETPPTKERLLLIISAAGSPPEGQLIGKSEIIVGYWTGWHFRPLAFDPTESLSLQVSHWTALKEISLPHGVVWQARSEFREDHRG